MRMWLGTRKTEEVANKVKDAIIAQNFKFRPVVTVKEDKDFGSINKGNFDIIITEVDFKQFDEIQDFVNAENIY